MMQEGLSDAEFPLPASLGSQAHLVELAVAAGHTGSEFSGRTRRALIDTATVRDGRIAPHRARRPAADRPPLPAQAAQPATRSGSSRPAGWRTAASRWPSTLPARRQRRRSAARRPLEPLPAARGRARPTCPSWSTAWPRTPSRSRPNSVAAATGWRTAGATSRSSTPAPSWSDLERGPYRQRELRSEVYEPLFQQRR
ncbi:hypothetical protein LV779_28275 [Streptomyces thinghirensis]|nr:hypothetical protein [Streptomyces thinghirensis]